MNVPLKKCNRYSCASVFHIDSSETDEEYIKTEILKAFPGCVTKLPQRNTHSSVFHHIPTTPAQPFRTKKRDLPIAKRNAVEKLFLELENSGVVRRSSSPWASAIHVVTKPDGSFRPCGDYRFLNSITVHDSYPMPLITDIMSKLHGMSYFSKIDLEKAFHQIPVSPSDIEKTAVITPFGLFEYLMMPFGLRNAAQTFQRHIDHVLRNIDNATPYLDDIIIYSPDITSHKRHVDTVLENLNKANLVINIKKCEFFKSQVNFLGHVVSADGVRPIPSRLQAICELKLPKTVTNLRSLLGTINFYHRFIPKASTLLAPLSSLATGPKTSIVPWTEHTMETFQSLKAILTDLVALKFYNPSYKLQLTTDASDVGIGAVLHQISDKGLEPLEFFSRTLNTAQRNYSAFDRELLAIHEAVKHFRNILDGRSFTIFTDHKPLIHLSLLKNPSPRQMRQITFLSEYDFSISHISGKDNIVADYFSRPDISAISRIPLFSDTPLETFKISENDISYFGDRAKLVDGSYFDISIPGSPRPILPPQLRKKAFDSVHSLHHPGNHKTYDLMHTRFIWPFMRRDVKLWCQSCIPCQENKITRHTKPPIIRFPTGNRFSVLHLDIVGPLPNSQGNNYILTMIDRKTRWVEATPISSITASNVAKHLVDTWFSRYGIPDHIITDQGAQFESSLFTNLSTSFGFKHIHTTSYHPQANGMIERFHRSLKTSLRCLSIKGNWVAALPMVLLGWRNTVHDATGTSPAKLLFGIGTTFPSEFFGTSETIPDETLDLVRRHFLDSNTNPSFGKNFVQKSFIQKNLYSSKHVYIQARDTHHMKARYNGPYEVISFQDNNTVTISKDGKPYTTNIEKVKPAFGFEEPTSPPIYSSAKITIHHNKDENNKIEPTSTPDIQIDKDQIHTRDHIFPHTITPLSPDAADIAVLPEPSQRNLRSSLRKSPTHVPRKSVSFGNWCRLCEPNRSSSLPYRLSRLKE